MPSFEETQSFRIRAYADYSFVGWCGFIVAAVVCGGVVFRNTPDMFQKIIADPTTPGYMLLTIAIVFAVAYFSFILWLVIEAVRSFRNVYDPARMLRYKVLKHFRQESAKWYAGVTLPTIAAFDVEVIRWTCTRSEWPTKRARYVDDMKKLMLCALDIQVDATDLITISFVKFTDKS